MYLTSRHQLRHIFCLGVMPSLDFNPLASKGSYRATLNNTKLVHWPLMGGLLHLVQRGGALAGCGPAQSPLTVPNATAYQSTTSVPITVLLYDGPLLCGFNVAIKGLTLWNLSLPRPVALLPSMFNLNLIRVIQLLLAVCNSNM